MCENWGVHTKLRGDVSRKDLLATLRELPYQTWLSESVEDGAIDYPSAWVNVMLIESATSTNPSVQWLIFYLLLFLRVVCYNLAMATDHGASW